MDGPAAAQFATTDRGGFALAGVAAGTRGDVGAVAAASVVGAGRGFVPASVGGELGDVAVASSAGGGSALAGLGGV